MEEIDVSQLLNYLKSKVIYIIFAMSVAFCLASIYVNRFRIPEYTSSTTILLNQTSENTAISSNDITLNKSLISTYNEIIKSKKVLNQVINELSLEYDYSELVAKVNVGEITDTSIIRISVTDEDNQLAADIANCIAEIFSKEIVDIYNIENISIIDAAEVTEVASSTSTIKIIGIATIAGAVIASVIIFIVFYFDTTVKNEEDIERLTGLPVIGIVPVSREKLKKSKHREYYEELARKHKYQEILPVEKEVRKIDINKNEVVDSAKEINVSILPTINDEIKENTPIMPVVEPIIVPDDITRVEEMPSVLSSEKPLKVQNSTKSKRKTNNRKSYNYKYKNKKEQ